MFSIIVQVIIVVFSDHSVVSPSQEKITLKRVVDFVKDKGDENLRDINRKLQRMLEETLTKNMHLQQVSSWNDSIYEHWDWIYYDRDIIDDDYNQDVYAS